MPYGRSTSNDVNRPFVTGRNNYPGGGRDYVCCTPYGAPRHAVLQWSRSGTNASGSKGTSVSTLPGTFELVAVQVPKGPRLSYRVWSKRLKRYVWAREPITVYRLKRVRSKAKPSKGLDLLPNRLNYTSSRVSYFGGSDGKGFVSNWTGVYLPDPRWSKTYSGDLWASFASMGGAIMAPNAQNFTEGILSDVFSQTAARLEKSLLSRFYEKVKNQKVNLAQALAERAQTASLVSDVALRVARAYSALRKGNVSRAASIVFPRSSKQLANDWLVIQYGINPLISDIRGAANLLTDEPKFQYDVIVKRKETIPRQLLQSAGSVTGDPPHQTKVWSEGYVEVTYKARVQVAAAFGRHLNEVGLANLPALGWELLPYSFVIDWLLPISDYLNNQDAFSHLNVVYATKTVFMKEYVTFERHLGGKNNGYVYPNQTVGFVNERVSCVRSILTSIPSLPFPSFKDPTSAGHIANAIALLRQLKK